VEKKKKEFNFTKKVKKNPPNKKILQKYFFTLKPFKTKGKKKTKRRK
jgi:hypothetical protein